MLQFRPIGNGQLSTSGVVITSCAMIRSVAGCSTRARMRFAMNRAVRTGVPLRVTSMTSTMPRPVLISTRRPLRVATTSYVRTSSPASMTISTRSPRTLPIYRHCTDGVRFAVVATGTRTAQQQEGVVMSNVWSYRDTEWSEGGDLVGYDVEATDGSIGKIDEASNEAGSSYLVVDTGPWVFGKKGLLPAGTISRVGMEEGGG